MMCIADTNEEVMERKKLHFFWHAYLHIPLKKDKATELDGHERVLEKKTALILR